MLVSAGSEHACVAFRYLAEFGPKRPVGCRESIVDNSKPFATLASLTQFTSVLGRK